MEIKIWINITFNSYNQLDGKDEFLTTLKQDGVVIQKRTKWYPSYCTGQEISLLQVFINSPWIPFIVEAAAAGMLWDMAKAYIPKLFEALGRLKEQNQDFSVGCMQFEFDDITIKIKDLHNVDYAYLQDTFFNMGLHIEYLNQQKINNIREISLPYVKREEDFEDNREKYLLSLNFSNEIDYFWKINYADGCMTCYYNPRNKTIIEI